MLPGKDPEVKLADGHKLLIWWALEACGGDGVGTCGGVGGCEVCLTLSMRLLLVHAGHQGSMAWAWLLDGGYLTKGLSRQLSGQVQALGGGGFQGFEVALDGGQVSSRHGSGDRGEGGAGCRSCDGGGDGAAGQLQVAAGDLGRQAGPRCQVRRGGQQGGHAAGGQGGSEVIERPGGWRHLAGHACPTRSGGRR